MTLRRVFVFALLLVAMTGAALTIEALAAEPSAQSFLNGIYAAYKGKNAPYGILVFDVELVKIQ